MNSPCAAMSGERAGIGPDEGTHRPLEAPRREAQGEKARAPVAHRRRRRPEREPGRHVDGPERHADDAPRPRALREVAEPGDGQGCHRRHGEVAPPQGVVPPVGEPGGEQAERGQARWPRSPGERGRRRGARPASFRPLETVKRPHAQRKQLKKMDLVRGVEVDEDQELDGEGQGGDGREHQRAGINQIPSRASYARLEVYTTRGNQVRCHGKAVDFVVLTS